MNTTIKPTVYPRCPRPFTHVQPSPQPDMYTVVYKLRNSYWVIHYAGDPPREVNPSCTASFEAEVWGQTITTWEDN